MKKCFIISPIGSDGSPEREHANDVYDYIIRPAMEEFGVESLRSDHLHEPGKISEQMFRELFGSDVCVAVLTGHNPNVFYELALAQASGRPVIILIEKSEELPFDIRDLRSVAYDLKPRNLFERVFVDQLLAHLKNLDRLDWRVDSPFAGYAQAGGLMDSGKTPTYYERYGAVGGTEEWLRIMGESQTRCDLVGLTLDSWKNRKGFRDMIVGKANEGCPIRLLQMHHENPMLQDFAIGPRGHEYVAPLAKLTAEYFAELARDTPHLEFRVLRRGCPHFRIVLTDQLAFMSPYLYGDGGSPLLRAQKQSRLYEQVCAEFDVLWALGESTGP